MGFSAEDATNTGMCCAISCIHFHSLLKIIPQILKDANIWEDSAENMYKLGYFFFLNDKLRPVSN